MRYQDYISRFPNGRPYFGNAQDDSDDVSLPDSERQRLYQEGLGTLAEAIKNPTANGWIAKSNNIPGFDQWAAGNPEIMGDNDPRYQYLQQFYEGTTSSDFWEQFAVPAMMAAFTGGALGGGLPTSGFEGLGTFGNSVAAAGGNVFTGAANTANSPVLSGGAGDTTLLGGSGADTLGANVTGSSVSPTIDSLVPAIDTTVPAFGGSTYGAVGGAAPNLGFTIPGAGVNLANSAEVIAGAGSSTPWYQGILNGASNLFPNSTTGSLLGGAIQGGLGYLGAGQQADAFENVANQQLAIGAPFRQGLLNSYQPGFSLSNEPGYQDALNNSTDTFLRAASAGRAPGVSGGNPIDNPGAWAETLKYVNSNLTLPYLQNYRGQLGQFGGMGLNTSGQASLMGAQTAGGGLDAIGAGIGRALTPQTDWNKILGVLGNQNSGGLTIGGMRY